MTKILTCPECGHKNIRKLKVCTRCGKSIHPAESRGTQPEDIETPEGTEQRPQDADFSNLMNCPDCKREISINAPACPGCGAPIASAVEVAQPGSFIPYTDQEVAVMLSKKKNTSHLLHIILSVLTAGFWIIIWIMVSVSNTSENSKIDQMIKKGKKVKKTKKVKKKKKSQASPRGQGW